VSYLSVENSVNQGAPIELYEFIRGTSSWRYASCADAVTYNARAYEPLPIIRDRIKQGTDAFKNDIKLTFPRDNEFAAQYITFAPDDVTTVNIYRGHAGDNNFITYWKGRIIGVEISGNEVTIDCESVFTSIKRPGLRAVFEYTCRHALYGISCRAAPSAFEVSGTISNISGNGLVITSTAAGAYPSGYFTGGMAGQLTGVRRFITNHTGSDLTLSRPVPEFELGSDIKIYPGCDHTKETCNAKFNNLNNFGGFPWIPIRNPFDGNSIL
jgi:uncharacterized phage protein (TIGR02218 family)